MGCTDFHYVCVCIFVLVQLFGKSYQESTSAQNSENSPQSSGDVIMRQDAEEMFYNIDFKKYDGIRCPDPVPPDHGAIVGEGNQVGSVVYVQCQYGYRLEGPEVMACVPITDGAGWDPLVTRVCLDKPDVGPCRASLTRYYFSKTTMECHTFIYGGCLGNKNNFQTVTDCSRACLGNE